MLGLLADTVQVHVADKDTTSDHCNCECSFNIWAHVDCNFQVGSCAAFTAIQPFWTR